MTIDLQSKLEEQMVAELQSKLEEERVHMKLQVDKTIKEHMALWMITMQKVVFNLLISSSVVLTIF